MCLTKMYHELHLIVVIKILLQKCFKNNVFKHLKNIIIAINCNSNVLLYFK